MKKSRSEKLAFIFETGKRLRFYMDEVAVMQRGGSSGCLCDELSGLQLRTAMQVGIFQPISLSDLAGRMGVSPPSASVMVDKLVEKKVLSRDTDPDDRRRVQLRIHPEMQPAMDEMHRRFEAAFERIARRVGDENVEKWYEVMLQVRELLAEEGAL